LEWCYEYIKSLTKTTHYCKIWVNRIIEARFEINGRNLIILGLYPPAEGRKEETDNYYQQPQEIRDKTDKKKYILLMGDLNVRIGSQRLRNKIGTTEDPSINNNGRNWQTSDALTNLE